MSWESYIDEGLLAAGDAVTSIDNGSIKPTWSIDTDSDTYILQTVKKDESTRLHVQREMYNALDAANVPVPDVVYDAAGQDIPYQIVEYVEGKDPHEVFHTMENDDIRALTEEAGRYLANAHEEIDAPGYGWIRGEEDQLLVQNTGDWRGFYNSFLQKHLEMIRDGPLDQGGLLDRVEDVTDAVSKDVPSQPDASICHRDYRPGNLLVDGLDIVAVLDWDNAFAGDPRYDFKRAQQSFSEIFDESELQDALRNAFREAYEDVRGEMDEEVLDLYGVGAEIDHGAALTWAAENGEYIPEDMFEEQRERLDAAVQRLED